MFTNTGTASGNPNNETRCSQLGSFVVNLLSEQTILFMSALFGYLGTIVRVLAPDPHAVRLGVEKCLDDFGALLDTEACALRGDADARALLQDIFWTDNKLIRLWFNVLAEEDHRHGLGERSRYIAYEFAMARRKGT